MRHLRLASLALVLLSGCMVGPNYTRPSVPMAPAFKEAPPTSFKEDDGWKLRMGADDMSDEGEKFLNSMFDQQIKRLEQTTADIKAGKLHSRVEAMKALASHSPFGR